MAGSRPPIAAHPSPAWISPAQSSSSSAHMDLARMRLLPMLLLLRMDLLPPAAVAPLSSRGSPRTPQLAPLLRLWLARHPC
jgi:hypothetical protein